MKNDKIVKLWSSSIYQVMTKLFKTKYYKKLGLIYFKQNPATVQNLAYFSFMDSFLGGGGQIVFS